MESTKKMKDQLETDNPLTESKSKISRPENREQNETSTGGGLGNLGSNLSAKGGEVVEQAKEVASDVYNRASKGLNQSYNQAMDYGRENPGTATLIAFGAGVGVGLLIAGSLTSPSRTRTGRIVPPVMNALSQIASEIFR
jgi:ElaB/YqjD/DUF883 family membrane-anchored ribosome-binding protein